MLVKRRKKNKYALVAALFLLATTLGLPEHGALHAQEAAASKGLGNDAHAWLGSETLFNVGRPTWRQVKKHLTRPGIITIECDVLHTWMSAYIVVTSTPCFAVTDARGEFVIEGVPAGTYEIEVWHEKLGRQSRAVNLVAGDILRTDFVYR